MTLYLLPSAGSECGLVAGDRDLPPRTVLPLFTTSDSATTVKDIQNILQAELTEIAKSSPVDVEATQALLPEIAKNARGSLIFASVSLGFTLQCSEAVTQLKSIWSHQEYTNKEKIDALYDAILEHAFTVESTHPERLEILLGLMVVSREPLSLNAMAMLLQNDQACSLDKSQISSTLQTLRYSVLDIPDDDSPTCIRHRPSLVDYLTDESRRNKPALLSDFNKHHRLAASHCFKHIRRTLKKNICGLDRYAMNPDPEIAKRSIDSATIYSCRYWLDHLLSIDKIASEDPSSDIRRLLNAFLSDQLLLWFEVLGLPKESDRASRSLNILAMWLNNVVWIIIDAESREVPTYIFDRTRTATRKCLSTSMKDRGSSTHGTS